MEAFSAWPGDGVLHLSGEFDLASALVFEEAATAPLDGLGPAIIDLSELTFIDASGVHVIILLAQRVGDGTLVLRSPRPNVARVFDILRVADMVGVHRAVMA